MDKYILMGGTYRSIFKPLFFRFDPEVVHDHMTITGNFLGRFKLTRWLSKKVFSYTNAALKQTLKEKTFVNPIGLSAGFDKNAKLLNILPSVGFGFMEIGSITYEAYEGNEKPRLFRLPKSKGLVVYYGLMNDGVKKIAKKIKEAIKSDALVGISIAKTNSSKTATEDSGILDYYNCLKYVEDANIGDYYTLNISCPNTFGGEPFTTKQRLEKLLEKLSELKITKPIFVKMPINLDIKDFDQLLQVCINYKIDGVIIGNLTKVRDPKFIKDSIPDHVKGGISGKPTEELSNFLISYTYKSYGDRLIIVGVGGVFNAQDAYEKIKRGASLIQLITGMIFNGPQLIGEINRDLVKLLRNDGYNNISEAIGIYHKQL